MMLDLPSQPSPAPEIRIFWGRRDGEDARRRPPIQASPAFDPTVEDNRVWVEDLALALHALMGELPLREQFILFARFYTEMSMTEIGRVIHDDGDEGLVMRMAFVAARRHWIRIIQAFGPRGIGGELEEDPVDVLDQTWGQPIEQVEAAIAQGHKAVQVRLQNLRESESAREV